MININLGNEHKSYLLYFAAIILDGILPEPFYSPLCQMIKALSILNKLSLDENDLNTAHEAYDSFVSQFEELYGMFKMISRILTLTLLFFRDYVVCFCAEP